MFLVALILSLFLFPHSVLAIDPIVKITNFSSNSSPEWVEIHNQTTNTIDLAGWKLQDASQTDLAISGCLSANSYLTVYNPNNWLNNTGDTITLIDNTNTQIDQFVYAAGKYDTSQRSDSSCTPTAIPTPTITPTVAPTNTPVPQPTLTSSPTPTSSPTSTPSPTRTPTNIPTNTPTITPTQIPSPTLAPTSSPLPTSTLIPTPTPTEFIFIEPTSVLNIEEPSPSQSAILGTSDIITPTFGLPKPSAKAAISSTLVSVIFISLGFLLLFAPFVVLKLKK